MAASAPSYDAVAAAPPPPPPAASSTTTTAATTSTSPSPSSDAVGAVASASASSTLLTVTSSKQLLGGSGGGDAEAGKKPKPGAGLGRSWERWVVLAVSSVGGLLAAIQSSALIIAFPVLIAELQCELSTMLWVLISFLLVVSAIVPVCGKLGDVFGQAILFDYGFLIFTVSTLLAGFSQPYNHGYDLVGYRVIMGFGGTFLFTNSVAIVTERFMPYKQVGLAQGIFQLAFASGSVLGPVVGGGLSQVDWRWIFWFNTPIAGVCTVLSFILIRDPPNRRGSDKSFREHMKTFDFLGSLLIMVFLTLIILALTQAVLPDPNLSSPGGLAALVVVGTAALVGFVLVEMYQAKNPLIPPELFLNNRTFALTTLAGFLVSFGRGNITYAMIFFLQGPYADSPLTAGIQLIPLGLGIVLTGFLAGGLSDKVGVRGLSVVGPVVIAAGVFGLAFSTVSTNYWLIAFALFISGVGNGLFVAPNGLAGMTSVRPEQRGVAAAVRLCFSFLPQMIGIVITFAIILNSLSYNELLALFIFGGGLGSAGALDSFMRGVQLVYWITIAALLLASVVSIFVPNRIRPMGSPPSNENVAPGGGANGGSGSSGSGGGAPGTAAAAAAATGGADDAGSGNGGAEGPVIAAVAAAVAGIQLDVLGDNAGGGNLDGDEDDDDRDVVEKVALRDEGGGRVHVVVD